MLIPRNALIRNIVRPASAAFGARSNSSIGNGRVNVSKKSASTTNNPTLSNRPSNTSIAGVRSIQPLGVLHYSTTTTVETSAVVAEEEAEKIEEEDSADHLAVMANASSLEKIAQNTLDQAIAEFDAAKANGPLTVEHFTDILLATAVHKDFVKAYSYYKEAEQHAIDLTADACAYVIRAGRRTLRSMEIRELFGTVSERLNQDLQNNTVAHSPFYTQIKEIVDNMRASGLDMPMWLYEDLATSMQNAGQAGVIVNLAISLENRGITPSTRFYNRMLYALPRSGFSDRADVLFSRMVLNNLADATTYVIRMGSLVYVGRYEEAFKLFEEMAKQYAPSTVAFNTVIQALLQARQPERAIEMLNRMKLESEPNHVTANSFVTYYYNTGDTTTTKEILNYFTKEKGFPETSGDYSSLLKFYARYDPSSAVELLKHIFTKNISWDTILYNGMISVLIDRRVLPDWKRNFSTLMLDRTYNIEPEGLAALCMSLPFPIRQLLAKMESKGVIAGPGTYELLLRAHLNRRDNEGVKRLWSFMIAKPGNIVYPSHRNVYLSALLNEGNQEDIMKHLEHMRMKRASITAVNGRRLREMKISPPYGTLVLGDREEVMTSQPTSAPSLHQP